MRKREVFACCMDWIIYVCKTFKFGLIMTKHINKPKKENILPFWNKVISRQTREPVSSLRYFLTFCAALALSIKGTQCMPEEKHTQTPRHEFHNLLHQLIMAKCWNCSTAFRSLRHLHDVFQGLKSMNMASWNSYCKKDLLHMIDFVRSGRAK